MVFLITHGNLSQFEEPIRHRCGSNGGPSEPWDQCRQIISSIEPVFEFGEVARDMLAVDGAVGSCDGGLDVAECGVDPFERRRACRLRS